MIGSLEHPEALILARHDHHSRLRVAGRTTPLPPAARTEIAAVLAPAACDHPWPPAILSSRFGQLPSKPIDYLRVAPTAVVELDVDTAFETNERRTSGSPHASRPGSSPTGYAAGWPAALAATAGTGLPRPPPRAPGADPCGLS